jgi:hypothetical protein
MGVHTRRITQVRRKRSTFWIAVAAAPGRDRRKTCKLSLGELTGNSPQEPLQTGSLAVALLSHSEAMPACDTGGSMYSRASIRVEVAEWRPCPPVIEPRVLRYANYFIEKMRWGTYRRSGGYARPRKGSRLRMRVGLRGVEAMPALVNQRVRREYSETRVTSGALFCIPTCEKKSLFDDQKGRVGI